MKFLNSFPLAFVRRHAPGAFLLVIILAGFAVSVSANNNSTKPAARPVARLVSTSEDVRPTRTRVVNVTRSAATAASAVPAEAVNVPPTQDEKHIFDILNAERTARGQRALAWDGSLARMARQHSENMARRNFFSHDGPGGDLSDRADASGVRGWRSIGENIAYSQGFDDPVVVTVEGWMHSTKHRDNILTGSYTHSAIGIAKAPDGRIFYTQVFVTR